MLKPIALLALAVTAAACGGESSPSSSGTLTQLPLVPTPSLESQWLRPGTYDVFVGGSDFGGDFSTVVCSPVGVPPAGKFVRTEIELAAEGDWLVGHAVAGDINLELRIRDAGAPLVFGEGRPVTGEVRGWATDRGATYGPTTDVTFATGTIGGGQPATVTGRTFPALGAALSMLGAAEGRIVFYDTQGRTAVCPSITLNVGRRGP